MFFFLLKKIIIILQIKSKLIYLNMYRFVFVQHLIELPPSPKLVLNELYGCFKRILLCEADNVWKMRFKINAIFLKRPVLSTWYYIYLSFLRIQFNKNTFLVVYVGRKVASIVEKFHSLYSPYERLTNPIISYILYIFIHFSKNAKMFLLEIFLQKPMVNLTGRQV